MIKKICKNCSSEFECYPSDNKKFCSYKCRNESYIGKKASDETKNKMKIKRNGKKPALGKHWKLSDKTKQKISLAQSGNKGYWYGKKRPHTEETKRKIGLANAISNKGKKQSLETIAKRIKRGEKHYNWKGGKSFEPYSVDWTQTLKRSIRERDKYVCQLCGLPQGDRVHNVHHIDYDKENCDPKNLVTLCQSCHSKTNFNRIYWIRYFNNLLN